MTSVSLCPHSKTLARCAILLGFHRIKAANTAQKNAYGEIIYNTVVDHVEKSLIRNSDFLDVLQWVAMYTLSLITSTAAGQFNPTDSRMRPIVLQNLALAAGSCHKNRANGCDRRYAAALEKAAYAADGVNAQRSAYGLF